MIDEAINNRCGGKRRGCTANDNLPNDRKPDVVLARMLLGYSKLVHEVNREALQEQDNFKKPGKTVRDVPVLPTTVPDIWDR